MSVRPLWITLWRATQSHEITGGCAPFYRTDGVDKGLACVARHKGLSWSCETPPRPRPAVLSRARHVTRLPRARPRQVFHRACRRRGESDRGRIGGASKLTGVSMRRVLVYLWTLPTTCFGLVFFPLAVISGGGYQVVDGVLE